MWNETWENAKGRKQGFFSFVWSKKQNNEGFLLGQKVAGKQGTLQFYPISIVSIGRQCTSGYFIHFSEMAKGRMRSEWT